MKTFRCMLLILLVLLTTACGSKPTPFALHFNNPYAPQPGDNKLMAGDIKIDSSSVFLAASQPPQVRVNFAYFPPTPCYQLRVEVNSPNEQNQIELKAYAVAEKDKPCTLMALATPLQANLNLGSVPGGHYTVLLNGDQIGEFDS